LTVVSHLILLQQYSGEGLQDLKAVLTNGTTAINSNDEILRGNTDLRSSAIMNVARRLGVAVARLLLGTLSLTSSWDEDMTESQLEATTTSNGTRGPPGPALETAISITRHAVACTSILNSVALFSSILWLHHNVTCARLETTLALCCALGETRPSRHQTIDWALVLATADELLEEGTSDTTFVRCCNNRPCHQSPPTALERLAWIALIITRHRASVLHERVQITILD
jgi:hypothetical protein